MSITDAIFWIAMTSIVVSHMLGAWLVLTIKDKHAEIYEKLGRPAPISRWGFFVFRLSFLEEYAALAKREKVVVRILQCLGVIVWTCCVTFLISVFST